MAIIVRELWDSRNLSEEVGAAAISLHYLVTGTFDEDEVYLTLQSASPSYWANSLQRRRVLAKPLGGGVWDCNVEYGTSRGDLVDPTGTPASEPAPDDPLGAEFSFDTSGGTQHITQSLETISRTKAGSPIDARDLSPCSVTAGAPALTFSGPFGGFTANDVGAGVLLLGSTAIPAGTTITSVSDSDNAEMSANAADDGEGVLLIFALDAPDHKGAIGVGKDSVAGCDIIVPKLEFTITRELQRVTLAYIQTLKGLTGKVNDAAYMGFALGELLFMGASGGGATGDKKPRITYKFSASENDTNIEIASDLRIPKKKGWEYSWVIYEPAIDSNGYLATKPAAAYVEKVYKLADFKLLGL